MNQNHTEEKQFVFTKVWDDLMVRYLSNCEKRDTTILTTSLTALGLSLILVMSGWNPGSLRIGWCLLMSWWCFGLAILSTMLSFPVSDIAIKLRLKSAIKYYQEQEQEDLDETCVFSVLTDILDHVSVIMFILAITFIIAFVFGNLRG